MQMNLWRCTEPGTLHCHFGSSDISIQQFKNDTEKPFRLEVGGFLPSSAVLLSVEGVGDKAIGRVGRMTSHLGQSPGWALLLFHLDPSDGPRPPLGHTLGPSKSPIITLELVVFTLRFTDDVSVLFYHLLGVCFLTTALNNSNDAGVDQILEANISCIQLPSSVISAL